MNLNVVWPQGRFEYRLLLTVRVLELFFFPIWPLLLACVYLGLDCVVLGKVVPVPGGLGLYNPQSFRESLWIQREWTPASIRGHWSRGGLVQRPRPKPSFPDPLSLISWSRRSGAGRETNTANNPSYNVTFL